jgi:hypothetical protein
MLMNNDTCKCHDMVCDPHKCHGGINQNFPTNSTWQYNFKLIGHLVVIELQTFGFVGLHMALSIILCQVHCN